MTPTLRVDPDELRTVAAGWPGADRWELPGPDRTGLPGSGWSCLPALAAVTAAARARVDELAAEAGWLAARLREAARAYDDADDRAAARATGARARVRQ
jgi:hypothetical protein